MIRRAAPALLALVACATWPLLGRPATGTGQTAAPATALPVLGVADRDSTLVGAVTSGEHAGEVWAYRRLPLDAQPPVVDGKRLEFGAVQGGAVPPQLAFLRHTASAGWQVALTPRDLQDRAYRGPDPNPRSARLTARGGGVLVGQDGARPAAEQLVMLRRASGDTWRELAPPPAGVLLAEGDPAGEPAEALAGDRGAGRVNVAVADDGSRTVIYAAPVGRDVEGAVLVNDGADGADAWHREPIELPPGTSSFAVAGIAAADSGQAWLVGGSPGSPVQLFQRVEDPAPHWQPLELPAGPLTDLASAGAAGVDDVAPLGGRAQTITATSDGIWVDVRARSGAAPFDATLFVRPDLPLADRVTSWCDSAFCDHLFAAAFSTTDGYRSFAWPGAGAGARVITNPLRPGAQGESNRGTWLRLAGDRFERLPGGGGNFRASGAFANPSHGWLEGPVEIGQGERPDRLRSWPVALRAPLTAVAGAPGAAGSIDVGAVAVGVDGAVARYAPGAGWTREFLLSGNGSVVKAGLRGVAWPEPGRAHAVGDVGAMWMWRADTGLWERDPAAPVGFEGNLMAVAFDPADAQRGYAVGKGGLILRYDKTWTTEALPAGFAGANFTAVFFAGRQAIAVSDVGVLVNDGAGWQVDADLRDLLATLPGASVSLVAGAGLPDGGAVIGGRTLVVERDSASGGWRFAAQPLLGQTVIAVAAVRDGDRVSAIVSTVPALEYPVPDPPLEVDPNSPAPLVPPFGLPGDGYLLRETRAGWIDDQRTAFAGAGSDRPLKSDPVLAFDLAASGEGWAVGGWSGYADSAGRGSSARGGTGRAIRARVATSAVLRYSPAGVPAAPAGFTESPVPLYPGPVRFAIGGHAQCSAPCADLANQELAPDRMLRRALDLAGTLAQRDGGPRAFLYTGGRIDAASGVAGDAAEEQRYARLLTSRDRLPVYGSVAAGDLGADGASSYLSAFAGAPSPFGTTDPGAGIATSGLPGAAPGPGARTHYAFDTAGAGGTVRVVVIDNSAGSLAGSDQHQNPAEPQAPWLTAVLDDAKAKGIVSIVVGSRDLNPRAVPALNVASDGDETARLLVEHGASAYFYDRPEENRAGRIPAGAATTIPTFGTGSLGYRSAIADSASVGLPDALFGDGGFLLAEVAASGRDPVTNRAPVTVRLIPVIEDLSLEALDGSLLRRSRPSLFQGLGRRPVAGDRWGRVAGDGIPEPSGADPYASFPSAACLISGCSSRITPEYAFSSRDPDILDFVRQDPATSNLRKPLLGADDKVISDTASGLVCPFNAGSTIVTVSAGGRATSQTVQVLPGSVQRPCGTRPLSPDKIRQVPRPPAAASAPPPPPAATPAVLPALVPPPPPAPDKPPPERPKPRPPAELPFFGGFQDVPPTQQAGSAVSPPPPPAAFFANPIPPGGATVRVHEEKREEEVAPEQSQANAVAYRADDGLPLEPFVAGMLIIALLAGLTIRPGRHRAPQFAITRLTFDDHRTDRHRRRP